MIRTSSIVAIAAILVSLVLHGLGLSLGTRETRTQTSDASNTDVTETGGAFEDFAKPAPPAEQPDVTPPDTVVEEPTSNALVASDNPQNTLTPDAAAAEDSAPDAEEQAEGEPEANEPQEQAGADDDNIGELAALLPVETPADGTISQTEPDTNEPNPAADDAPEIVTPVVPELAPTQEPDSSAEVDVSEPEETDVDITSNSDDSEILAADETEDLSQSAVTRSLRPPAERPSTEELGATEYVQQQRQARVIESPLDVYRRTGVDQLSLGRSGGSGSTSFVGSGGAGNASVTNYVGRVLVQLNRFPVGRTSDSGTARVQFQINPNGSLAWVRIVRSSGSAAVDRAATTQVRRAAPFPRTPNGASQRLVFLYRNK